MLHTNFPIFVYRKRRILLKYKFEKKNSKTTKNLELEKKILPMIYDNTINEPLLRSIALQIFVNATFICTKNFCEK